MRNLRLYLIYFFIFIAIVLLDRFTKKLALKLFSIYSGYFFYNIFNFELIINRGISLGLFNSTNSFIFALITVSVILITIGIIFYAIDRFNNKELVIGEILVISGSLSNIYDRIFYGGVIDFVSINYLLPFTYFNIADISIFFGIMLMIFQFYKYEFVRN